MYLALTCITSREAMKRSTYCGKIGTLSGIPRQQVSYLSVGLLDL